MFTNPTKALKLLDQVAALINESVTTPQQTAFNDVRAAAQADKFAEQDTNAVVEFKAAKQKRLRATDWTQLADADIDGPKKAEFNTYRAALRALVVNNKSDYDSLVWPSVPSI